MDAQGLVFLGKARPLATRSTSGEFQLTLLAMDRIGPGNVEPWRITWTGPEAEQFWDEHQQHLTAGTPLRVEADRLRIHQPPHCRPEMHCRARRISLAPRRHDASNQAQAEAA